MARLEIQTLDEIDRMVSSLKGAEALRKNPSLNDAERALLDEWLDSPRYGGKVRDHERTIKSLEDRIGYAQEISSNDAAHALLWAKAAAVIAAIALAVALTVLIK